MLLSICYSSSGFQVLSFITISIRMWSTWLGLLPALSLSMTNGVEVLVRVVVLVTDMVDMVLLLFKYKTLLMFLISLKKMEQFAIKTWFQSRDHWIRILDVSNPWELVSFSSGNFIL